MSIINNGLLLAAEGAAAGGYEISRSLRFNSADSAYLNRTPASAGNRKTWTWSGWVKRAKLGTYQTIFGRMSGSSDATWMAFRFQDNDKLVFLSWNTTYRLTTQVFRDASAWYHLVVTLDTTQSTAADRLKIYVNGTQIQTFDTNNAPTQNADLAVNDAAAHGIGYDLVQSTNAADLYLADVHFIDGQALAPTSFGEFDATTGVWNPAAYGGSYGTNGFHLTFSDNSGTTSTTLGKDAAGSNNWTPNNFSVAAGSGNDSLVDVPTLSGTDTGAGGEVRGNYATLNPLDKNSSATLSNGNLDYAATAGAWRPVRSTIGIAGAGKWYWEILIGGTNAIHGIATQSTALTDDNYPGIDSTSYGYLQNGNKYNNGSGSSYGSSFTTNDVIGVAYDAANGKLWFSKNGTWQASGDPAAGTNAAFTGISTSLTYFPMFAASVTGTTSVNTGARAFAYTAPSGFKALCTANLPTPTIAKPSTVMDVALYTGNGSTQTISGLGFSPDFVFIKPRNFYDFWTYYDQVRGAGAFLVTENPYAESSNNEYGVLSAFTSTGFTVAGGSINANRTNRTGIAYAAWAWDAGSSTVSNTDGSITSSVRANASAGFSVVTFTGPASAGFGSVGHGLGAEPYCIICKDRTNARNWSVYHKSVTTSDYKVLALNLTTGVFDSGTPTWDISEINSTIFTPYFRDDLGASYNANNVAYCFAPVAGYSAMGSYVGNGSTDGVFVYTGFRVKFLLVKRTDTAEDWFIWDAARDSYNVSKAYLRPNLSDAENTTYSWWDFLSNGFKARIASSGNNASGGTYIYMALAESPFQYARAR